MSTAREGTRKTRRGSMALLLAAALALGSVPSGALAFPHHPGPPDMGHIHGSGGGGGFLPPPGPQPFHPGPPGPPPFHPGPPGPPPPHYHPYPVPYPYPPNWWGNDHHDNSGAIVAGLALGALAVAAASSPQPTPAPAPVPAGQSWQQIEVDGQTYYKMGDQYLKAYVENGQVVYRTVPNPIH